MKVSDTRKQEVILEDLILAAKNSPKIWLAVNRFRKSILPKILVLYVAKSIPIERSRQTQY